MRVVSQYITTVANAGPKAKIDVEKILKDNFEANIYTNKLLSENDNSIIHKFKKILFTIRALSTKEKVIIQHPFSKNKKMLNLSKNKIAFIHDLDGLRMNDDKLLQEEVEALNLFDCVIAHNAKMKEFLIENKVKTPIYVLELFDYITHEEENNKEREIDNEIKIVYTGNIERDKAAFLYQLENEKMKFHINVYGAKEEEILNKKIHYKGKKEANRLPNEMEGNVGLVWDGNIDESDENVGLKNYTKYNNPHKFSCYIAAGLPVIVWRKSAIADFVKKHNIGYVISNLYEINEIDFKDYDIKRNNVKELSKKVRAGYYTKNIIEQITKEEI